MAKISELYRSYSSIQYLTDGNFKLSGVDTIKMDILSHLYTDVDERVMLPGWGTIIPRLPFEPMTSELVDRVYDDVVRVVNYDPRVTLSSVLVTPVHDMHILTIEVTFTVNETQIDDSLFMVVDTGSDI